MPVTRRPTALAAAWLAVGLMALGPAAEAQTKAKPKAAASKARAPAKAPDKASPAPPPPPTYPARLANFPCQPVAGQTSADILATIAAGAKRSVMGRVGGVIGSAKDKTLSVVGDRFSISGDDGVFLCGPKVLQRVAEHAVAKVKASAPQLTPTASPSPVGGPNSGRGNLGLAAFADIRGDLRPDLFHMPDTQTRLQAIVDRIATAWPYPDAPHPTVLVNSGLRFNAESTPDNTIIVWLGVLAPVGDGSEKNMFDTDLYWLLAHEYSHIALGHTDKPDAVYGQVRVLGAAAGAYMSAAQLTSTLRYSETRAQDPALGGRIHNALQMHDSLRFLTKSVIEPAWGRLNEDEADTAGTDLITSLGYFPRFNYVADRFALSETTWNTRISAAEAAIGTRVDATVTDPAFSASLKAGDVGGAFGQVGESIKKGGFSTTRKWVTEFFTRDHRGSAAREDGLERYKTAAYVPRGLSPEVKPLKDEITALLRSPEVAQAITASQALEATQDALTVSDLPKARREIAKALATPYRREASVRFWAARVALADSDRAAAIVHLEAARQAPSVSPMAYRELAGLYTKAGEVPKAQVVIAEGRERTGDYDYFLPEDVRIAARAMDKQIVGGLMRQCRAAKRESIAYDCTEALSDIDWSKLSGDQKKVAMQFAVWGDVAALDKPQK